MQNLSHHPLPHAGIDIHEHGNHAHDFTRPRKVGRYLVSPLIKQTENGTFAISVSIRSGSGSATTDRVLRLTGLFPCPREAAAYARSEALQWITPPQRMSVGA
jgi:hypothetical protein